MKRLQLPNDLVIGPSALVLMSLLDIYVATRVFANADHLTASLAYFIFGAATGVPLQLWVARVAVRFGAQQASKVGYDYDRKAAIATGLLAAVATATWLYCLNAADPAIVFPLANLSSVIVALHDAREGLVLLRKVIPPLLVFIAGLGMMRIPTISSVYAIAPIVIAVLTVRNVANAGSEIFERAGSRGCISRFTAMRFVWLAAGGLPLAVAVALATGRTEACARLIAKNFTTALPIHTATMLLSFTVGLYRTRAKGKTTLTLCNAAFSVPLVVAPAAAMFINQFAPGFFPTVHGSLSILPCVLLVISGVTWLSIVSSPSSPIEQGSLS